MHLEWPENTPKYDEKFIQKNTKYAVGPPKKEKSLPFMPTIQLVISMLIALATVSVSATVHIVKTK